MSHVYKQLCLVRKRVFQLASMSSVSKKETTSHCIKNVINYWREKFLQASIDENEVSSSLKWIGESVADEKVSHKWRDQYVHWELALENNSKAIEEFEKLCQQREKRVPVQYLTKNWEFRNLNLLTREPVFIPRDATEELIDDVKDWINKKMPSRAINFLEIGTGTGAISLALLDELRQTHCTAIDRAQHAVELCTENATRLGLDKRIEILHQDFETFYSTTDMKFDVIVSNPPYMTRSEIAECQQELKYEDVGALDGGEDGLDTILSILSNAAKLLHPGGGLFLEVNVLHPEILSSIDPSRFPGMTFADWHRGVHGEPRFCRFERAEGL